ncbi:CHAT domain-containing protein [Mycobacterium sp. MMS18-G62]
MPPRREIPAEAMFVAGLMTADGSIHYATDKPAKLSKAVQKLLERCALAGTRSAMTPPMWVAPDPSSVAEAAPQLETTWHQIIDTPFFRNHTVLEIRVSRDEDAAQIKRWGRLGKIRIVVSIVRPRIFIDRNFQVDGFKEARELRLDGPRILHDAVDIQLDDLGADDIPRPDRAPRAEAEPPPQPEVETPRQLLAQMLRDGKVLESTLEPKAKHTLAVRIAIPSPGEQGVKFPEHEIEDDARGIADLIVDVSSDDDSFHDTAPLVLPTDRKSPSTVAAFTLVTGEEGSVLKLNITVLYRRRPIQAALLLATVRATPLPGERIQLLAVPLSAAPEPSPITEADVSLVDNGVTLAKLGTEDRDTIPLTGADDWAEAFEQEASQVLGNDFAPGAIDDPVAVELLVRLARRGTRFADTLADLGLRKARTISVLVRFNAPVLPFELAYDGPAPDLDAKVCDCGANPPPQPGERCPKSSRKRVCPSAFWGMNRVIARTVKSREAENLEPRPQPGTLSLRPVLYAAANRADRGSPPDELPSDQLEETLVQRAGIDHYKRVKNWRDWRVAVRDRSPQLLVVLGHTDKAQAEVTIEIGRKSLLAQPAISARELGTAKMPAPVVLLFACDSAVIGDAFGALPGTFIDKGAAAVVATLTKFKGQHAADAAAAVVAAMHSGTPLHGLTLGTALTQARRDLVSRGLLVGLLLVAHGEIDVNLTP